MLVASFICLVLLFLVVFVSVMATSKIDIYAIILFVLISLPLIYITKLLF